MEDKNILLQEVADKISICKKCRLCENRLNTVPGSGSGNANLMIISEGPGEAENKQGIPFCGRAGSLLNKIIKKSLKMNREEIFVTNVIKCRAPNNRDPLPDEVELCRHFLDEQINIVKPKVILLLGAVALKALFNNRYLGVKKNRGIWREYGGIPVMPTFHPAFLLRQYTEDNKDMVKSDLLKVTNRLQQIN